MTAQSNDSVTLTGIRTSTTCGKITPRSWTCRVISGIDAGHTITVGTHASVVGADATCDLVLRDPTVSRRHAEFRVSAEGMSVRDLGSRNGTFHQSSRIVEVVVPTDATIRVGKTKLQFSAVPPLLVEPSQRIRFGGLVGESLLIREVFAVLELASPTPATVLIEGESGTGKELAARAIHDHSLLAEKPFVVIDCSATQEQLIDSQLFGHVRGAFTGAVSSRKGAFVEANGGTLFLDEISELPLPSQAKLLRAIEARTVQPLGSDRPVTVDARVVAATNRELSQMVEEGKFRFDLYQRLAVIHIRIPPLRERPEDLPVLIRHFFEGRGLESGEIGGENLRRMQQYDWPGNVRELRNLLERAWVFAGPGGATFAKLHPWIKLAGQSAVCAAIDVSQPFKKAKEQLLEQFERQYLTAVLEAHHSNVSQAAQHAGINRNYLHKLLEKYGLTKP